MERKQYSGSWQRRLKFILKPYLPNNRYARIIDVGAGGGECVKALQLMGYDHVEGIDISEEQIAVAKANGVAIVKAEAISYLETHIDTYDVIITMDFSEHLSKDEIHIFLNHASACPAPQWQTHRKGSE
jgi:2-polyprenyl-3-methyl-5-hydroxy-6-metoxy-1,4-benzoquinol methylase